MNILSNQSITALLSEKPTSKAITMYVPTHRVSTAKSVKEDQIRFKNMSNAVLEKLEGGDNSKLITYFQEQRDALMNDNKKWNNMSKGLLICVTADTFQYYHLPIDCDEYIAVDDTFHLFPMYGLLESNQEFTVLVLSQKNPAVYDGNQLELVESLELPKDLETAIDIDEMHQKSVQHHSVDSGNIQFHGHGGGKDTGHEELLQFFRIIDGIVTTKSDTDKPLLLVGSPRDIHEYKSITKHPHIMEQSVHANLVNTPVHEIHDACWDVITEAIIEPQTATALTSLHEVQGSSPDKATSSMSNIEKAAESGRVETLFLPITKMTTDTVRNNKDQVQKIVFPEKLQSRQLDKVAKATWQQSGKVISVDVSKLDAQAAAILRY